jgi:hypothetical protein
MSHITIAASAKTFRILFNLIEAGFTFSKSDSANFGPFSASYNVQLHLSGGTIQLNDNNTIELQNVDIVFDTLDFKLCLNLPGFCIGGFCIVPDPWNGCLVSFPGFCIGGPVCADLDLSGLVAQVTDMQANLLAKYVVDPARPPGVTDVEAELQNHPNKWEVFVNPTYVNVIIDVPDTLDNILVDAIKNAINNLFPSWLPDWAKDIIWAFLGPIVDLIKSIIGIVGSIADWLENLLNNVFGLVPLIETAIADYFASQNPIYEFNDPYPILPASGILIPVMIPIRNLGATVNSKEMVVVADVGP